MLLCDLNIAFDSSTCLLHWMQCFCKLIDVTKKEKKLGSTFRCKVFNAFSDDQPLSVSVIRLKYDAASVRNFASNALIFIMANFNITMYPLRQPTRVLDKVVRVLLEFECDHAGLRLIYIVHIPFI